jgi:hypothetical protein
VATPPLIRAAVATPPLIRATVEVVRVGGGRSGDRCGGHPVVILFVVVISPFPVSSTSL